MASTDVWLGLVEAARLEGMSRKAIEKRLKNGAYRNVRQVTAQRGGGNAGKEWQIHLHCLSPLAQAAYARRHGGTREDIVIALPSDRSNELVPVDRRALGLHAYNMAGEKQRELAHIRKEILDAFDAATSRKRKEGKRLTQEEFCALYNEGRILSLKADVSGS